jgi:hypothetical protein
MLLTRVMVLSIGDYHWPPACGLCNHTMTADAQLIRLGCHCVFHQQCLQENIERSLLKHISQGIASHHHTLTVFYEV